MHCRTTLALDQSGDIAASGGSTVTKIGQQVNQYVQQVDKSGYCPVCRRTAQFEDTFQCTNCERPQIHLAHRVGEADPLCTPCAAARLTALQNTVATLEQDAKHAKRSAAELKTTTAQLADLQREVTRLTQVEADAKKNAATIATLEAEKQTVTRKLATLKKTIAPPPAKTAPNVNTGKAIPEIKHNPAGIDWRYVPAGKFLYGENKETREIKQPYFIAKTPVTNAQYKTFIDAMPHYPVPYEDQNWATPYNWNKANRTPSADKLQHPVVLVNHTDASAFCQWAMCQLPTEEQWERAARGTGGCEYPWGNSVTSLVVCNFNNQIGSTTPVGQFSPQGDSPVGAVDMAGNVYEWCQDWYTKDKTRVLRGGSWNYDGSSVRCADRDDYTPTGRSDNVGFRVALLLNF